jgi:hypothetical protein
LAAQQSGPGLPDRPPLIVEAVVKDHKILEFGAATPGGTYAKMPSQTGFVYFNESSITPVFNAGQGAGKGAFVAFSNVTYFGLDIPPQVKLGLDVSFAGAYVDINWAKIYDDKLPGASKNGDALADITVGPVLSYNVADMLILDLTARAGYGAAGGSHLKFDDYPLSDGSNAVVDDSNWDPSFGLSSAFGLRVRYGGFMLGLESHSNVGTRKHKYLITTTGKTNRTGDFEYSVNSPMPTMRLSLGIVY